WRYTYLSCALNIGSHRDLEVAIAFGTGFGSVLEFSDAKAARSSIKMFTTLLYTGPRVVVASVSMFRRGVQMRHVDATTITSAIGKVLQAEGRVSLETILEKHDESTHQSIIEDLLMIDGVVLLRSSPAGITLSNELTSELRQET
ncbi:hypothetical protein OAE80_02800, partial [Planctomycetaceae bacterium]|nr:hypothetical protein [Planctomycetaceae bacterium]